MESIILGENYLNKRMKLEMIQYFIFFQTFI